MKSQLNLQDNVLNEVRKNNISVVIYLMNGFQLKGKVIGFDNFTIILRSEGQEQLIYKHAISTISPQKKLENLFKPEIKEEDHDI
ncbi:MAG: RNA chaperone Hfq [Halanaerobiaceae bacterium]